MEDFQSPNSINKSLDTPAWRAKEHPPPPPTPHPPPPHPPHPSWKLSCKLTFWIPKAVQELMQKLDKWTVDAHWCCKNDGRAIKHCARGTLKGTQDHSCWAKGMSRNVGQGDWQMSHLILFCFCPSGHNFQPPRVHQNVTPTKVFLWVKGTYEGQNIWFPE